MIGTRDHFILYNDDTFACLDCHRVHFRADWEPHYVCDGQQFTLHCIGCGHKLIVYRQDDVMHVTTFKLNKLVNKQHGKKDKRTGSS